MAQGLQVGGIQLVGVGVSHIQIGGRDRHRAVQKHGQAMRNVALLLQLPNGMQDGLCSSDGKHRHHGHAPTRGHALQGITQLSHDIIGRVRAVAIGRLDQHRIGLRGIFGRPHQQVVRTSQIA